MNLLNETIDGIEVVREIAEGGTAIVYEGRNKLMIPSALKVLLPKFSKNEEVRRRFEIEAKILAKLRHPNIVSINNYHDLGELLVITMEYLDGVDLMSYIEANGKLSKEETKKIILQVLEGLKFAHRANILHRDIKPSNIFVTSLGQVKVLDFGISKILMPSNPEDTIVDKTIEDAPTRQLTSVESILGTPIFMSPEQIENPREVDERSDIYSLGVVMWTMLNGKLPYSYNSGSIADLSKISNSILCNPLPETPNSEHLNSVISKATEKNKNARFQNIQEFIDALELKYSPPPTGPRIKITAIILSFIGLIIAIGISTKYVLNSEKTEPVEKATLVKTEQGSEPGINSFGIQETKDTNDFYILSTVSVASESQAKSKAENLQDEGYDAGYLWIPNYNSLSGAPKYLVFIGPFDTPIECGIKTENYRKIDTTAYGFLVSKKNKRVIISDKHTYYVTNPYYPSGTIISDSSIDDNPGSTIDNSNPSEIIAHETQQNISIISEIETCKNLSGKAKIDYFIKSVVKAKNTKSFSSSDKNDYKSLLQSCFDNFHSLYNQMNDETVCSYLSTFKSEFEGVNLSLNNKFKDINYDKQCMLTIP